MASYRRTVLRQLSLANNAYINADITIYDADLETGQRTATLSTVYADAVGTQVVSNPYKLDSAGKAAVPLYVDKPVIIVFDTQDLGNHTSGVIYPQSGVLRDEYEEGEVYLSGDIVIDGALGENTKNVYVANTNFTSTSWAIDKANYLDLVLDVAQVQASADAAADSERESADSAGESADSAAAALTSEQGAATSLTLVQALSGSVPSAVALNFLRQNAAQTGFEYRTPAQVRDDISAAEAVTNYLVGTADPGVNNDGVDTAGLGQAFQPRSLWLNTTSNEFFVCLDNATGAANWQTTTLTLDDLGSMAQQDSSNVAITGGSITGVTGAGVASIVATGSVGNGDVAILRSDNTVEVVSETVYAEAEDTSGDAISFSISNSGSEGFWDAYTGTVVVRNGTTLYVGEKVSSTITFGSSNGVPSGMNIATGDALSLIPDTGTFLVVGSYPSGSNYYSKAAVGTITASTKSIAWGSVASSAWHMGNNSVSTMFVERDSVNGSFGVCIYQSSGGAMRAHGVSVSGTTATISSDNPTLPGNTSNRQPVGLVFNPEEEVFAICMAEYLNNSTKGNIYPLFICPFSFDGSTFAGGEAVFDIKYWDERLTASNGTIPHFRVRFCTKTNIALAVMYDDVNDGAMVFAAFGFNLRNAWLTGRRVLSRLDTTNSKFQPGNFDYISMDYEPNSALFEVVIGYATGSDIVKFYVNIIDDEPNIVSYSESDHENSAMLVIAGDDGLFYEVCYGGTDNDFVFQSQGPWTDTTADNWLGIFLAAFTDGQTTSVALPGQIVSNQSGLVANAIYYLADDGSLTTSPNQRRIGRGISATKLLIEPKGQ